MIKINIKDMCKFSLPMKILIFAIILVFVVSLIIYNVKKPGKFKLFYFQKVGQTGLFVENRFVPDQKDVPEINCFIDELLLGPMTNRYEALFPNGTRLLSCFQRNNILYINLSQTILNTNELNFKIDNAIEILKKNIFKNFSDVDIIHIYIDGKEAYEKK